MTFYEELSNYYDYIFPVNEKQLNFFQEQFKANLVHSVLDIACGSGNYTLAFANWGLHSVGIDLEADMIEKAKEKSFEKKNISFMVGDMRNLPFLDREFDSAICIGNSLPHILKDGDLRAAVVEMFRILNKEGILILQTVNYDRILKNKVRELPLIENENPQLSFKRFYEFREDGLIDFNTELEVLKSNKTQSYKNTVILRPLKKAELKLLLEEVGFHEINFFGAFDGQEHSEEAPATIIVARK